MDPVPGTRGGHDFRDPSFLLGQDRERVPMMFIGTSRTVLFRAQKTTPRLLVGRSFSISFEQH